MLGSQKGLTSVFQFRIFQMLTQRTIDIRCLSTCMTYICVTERTLNGFLCKLMQKIAERNLCHIS